MSQNIKQKLFLPLLLLISFASVIILKMGSLFILLALIPSLIAYYIDNSPGFVTFKTVLACNGAAIIPVIFPMLEAGFAFKPYNSFAVISDPMNWVVVYAGAALGWCLIFLCQFIARFMVVIAYEHQIRGLEHANERLVKEWGKEVMPQDAVPKPADLP